MYNRKIEVWVIRMRGRKPKPAYLKLVEGNRSRRPIFADPAPAIAADFNNGLQPPRKLRKRQQELWNQYIRPCPWLSFLDAPKAHLWVELHAEFERDPTGMLSTRIAQLRALASELGLDPANRARLTAAAPERPSDDAAAKYLT